jgi:hypothetical protein
MPRRPSARVINPIVVIHTRSIPVVARVSGGETGVVEGEETTGATIGVT